MLTTEKTIGEIVAQDFRTAAVFKKYGIDFCCKGNRSIDDACESKNINAQKVYHELENLQNVHTDESDFNSWPLDLLVDYIEKVHHRYVEEKTTVLLQFLNKVSRVHGGNHSELLEVYELFEESAEELAAHMKKEELILFPFVKMMVEAERSGNDIRVPHFGTVENPVAMMKHDHDTEGDRFRRISELTKDYSIPDGACNTFQVTYKMLEEFQNDLHKHIHLENNILFPKAIALEARFR